MVGLADKYVNFADLSLTFGRYFTTGYCRFLTKFGQYSPNIAMLGEKKGKSIPK
jgi:hypothetical protein